MNIYSFSRLSWLAIAKRLDQYISAGRVHEYYEAVFKDMVADGGLSLQTVSFDGKPWYEIDTIADLAAAEKLFSADTYETTIRNHITSLALGKSRPLVRQTLSRQAEAITRTLSGARPVPQSDAFTGESIHGSVLLKNKKYQKKPTGTVHEAR